MTASRNVSRAIARSRAVRARLARSRRRKWARVACLGGLVVFPIRWTLAEPAGAVVEAAVGKAQDLADLLSERSPGMRTQDELTKHVRAAPKVRTPSKPAAHPQAPALVGVLQPPLVPVEVAFAEPPPFSPPTTLQTFLASTPGFTPPGDNHDGPATLPSAQPRQVVPPTSAVPEPGTWAMMLMGFGLIAWRVRRRPATARLPRSSL
jgi:hypothetical protein